MYLHFAHITGSMIQLTWPPVIGKFQTSPQASDPGPINKYLGIHGILILHKALDTTPINHILLHGVVGLEGACLLYLAGPCLSWGVRHSRHLLQEALLVKVPSSRAPLIGPRVKSLSTVQTLSSLRAETGLSTALGTQELKSGAPPFPVPDRSIFSPCLPACAHENKYIHMIVVSRASLTLQSTQFQYVDGFLNGDLWEPLWI